MPVTEESRLTAFRGDALGHDDLVTLAARLRTREVSASELVDASIGRLESLDDRLGITAALDLDRARDRARRHDALKVMTGPFAGIPTMLKDNVWVEGMPMRHGSAALPATPRDHDGEFVRHFLDSGAVPIATSAMPPLGWTATTERVGGDVTRNPWNPAYSCGGSSGGSAVAVATGVVPIAHGNDGGGSLRIPAHACGLVTLKVTRGRLGADDCTKDMPVAIVTNGVLTRTVADQALAMSVLEKYLAPKGLERIGYVAGPRSARRRIGLLLDSPLAPRTDETTRTITQQMAERLEAAGHTVVPYEARVPGFFKQDFIDYYSLMALAIRLDGPRMFGPGFDRSKLEPMTTGISTALAKHAYRVPLMLGRIAASGRVYESRFGDVDAVLSPVVTHTNPKIGYLDAELPSDEHLRRVSAWAGFTPLANAAGTPALSLPAGLDENGCPVGVMFSGRHGTERMLLELAYEAEELTGFAGLG